MEDAKVTSIARGCRQDAGAVSAGDRRKHSAEVCSSSGGRRNRRSVGGPISNFLIRRSCTPTCLAVAEHRAATSCPKADPKTPEVDSSSLGSVLATAEFHVSRSSFVLRPNSGFSEGEFCPHPKPPSRRFCSSAYELDSPDDRLLAEARRIGYRVVGLNPWCPPASGASHRTSPESIEHFTRRRFRTMCGNPLKDSGNPLKDSGNPLKDSGNPLKDTVSKAPTVTSVDNASLSGCTLVTTTASSASPPSERGLDGFGRSPPVVWGADQIASAHPTPPVRQLPASTPERQEEPRFVTLKANPIPIRSHAASEKPEIGRSVEPPQPPSRQKEPCYRPAASVSDRLTRMADEDDFLNLTSRMFCA